MSQGQENNKDAGGPVGGFTDRHRRFLKGHIDTVSQLEALFLLFQEPEKEWPVKDVSETLRLDPAAVEKHLSGLSASGLLERTKTGYRYRPAKPEFAGFVNELFHLYQTHRTAIIECIYLPAKDQLKDFAESFRLRKED